MNDQFGSVVPDDLVVLDLDPQEMSNEELLKIDRIDWYRPDLDAHPGFGNLVLVSYKALAKCINGLFDGTDPKDCGLKSISAVEYIAGILHRWEPDYFYHA
jgi:hypothetical protein